AARHGRPPFRSSPVEEAMAVPRWPNTPQPLLGPRLLTSPKDWRYVGRMEVDTHGSRQAGAAPTRRTSPGSRPRGWPDDPPLTGAQQLEEHVVEWEQP